MKTLFASLVGCLLLYCRCSGRETYSAYDEVHVVDGAMPSKMEKRIRKHFRKERAEFDYWRIPDRAIIERNELF